MFSKVLSWGLAHEAELRNALDELHGDFKKWKSGEIDSFDLVDRIHKFHDGPNREIPTLHTSKLDLRFLIQRALQEGLIQKSDLPDEIQPYIDEFSSRGRNLFKD